MDEECQDAGQPRTGAVGGRRPLRITAADVGSRVVVRHLLPDGRATDVLGALVSLTADEVVVRRTDGDVVRTARTDVLAARAVPAAPARRSSRRPPAVSQLAAEPQPQAVSAPDGGVSVEEVARGAAATWLAHHAVQLGDWELRSSPGRASRGWSAVAVGDPGRETGAALDAVVASAREQAVPAAVTVATPLSGRPADDDGRAAALEVALAERGWVASPWTVVATAPAHDLAARRPRRVADLPGPAVVEVAAAPDGRWWAASHRDGGPLVPDDLPPPGPGTWFLTARTDRDGAGDRVLGVARVGIAVVGARTWVGLSCVHVRPNARRTGVARSLLASAAEAALAHDPAATVVVQVLEENAAARAAWRALDLTDHHRYRSWSDPRPSPRGRGRLTRSTPLPRG